jgi:hypothetical protein
MTPTLTLAASAGQDTVLNTLEIPTAEMNPLVTNIEYIYPFK